MSPEMGRGEENGLKTDVWSFGITIGVMVGLDKVAPPKYKGGIPGFIKDCAAGKNDLLLAREGIYLSAILKDLLFNMLQVNQKLRFTMEQVLNHKYIQMGQEEHSQGCKDWLAKEVPILQKLMEKEEEMLK